MFMHLFSNVNIDSEGYVPINLTLYNITSIAFPIIRTTTIIIIGCSNATLDAYDGDHATKVMYFSITKPLMRHSGTKGSMSFLRVPESCFIEVLFTYKWNCLIVYMNTLCPHQWMLGASSGLCNMMRYLSLLDVESHL